MLHELGDTEFEHFVGYVFQQAGYFVEHTGTQHGPGLDLKVFSGPGAARMRHAGVQVKHYVLTHKVSTHEVTHLRGGLPAGASVVGYFVTTSSFQSLALEEAKRPRRIWPIDGDHLLRYITYVRGSRPAVTDEVDHNGAQPGYAPPPIPVEALFTGDNIVRRSPNTTRVLALANHKGGVGKTTTALNLAFGLASSERDQQVLLVDLDPQANLTRALPTQNPEAAQAHIGDYFSGRRTLPELVRQTQFKRLWLIPSHRDLRLADHGLSAGPEAELRFVRDLHAPNVVPPPALDKRPFDWIIIDTGPSMGFFTRSAVAASHYVIMPVTPGVFADDGIPILQQTIDTMAALLGVPIATLGCVVTQWKDDALSRELVAGVEQRLKMLGNRVPFDRNHIEKAHLETGAGKKKNLFDKRSAAASAYLEVVDELVRRVQLKQSKPDSER